MRRDRFTRQKGVAAIECALVLMALIPLLFGIWEVGRIVESQQVLSNACREAGRAAASGAMNTAQVTDVFSNYLQRFGFSTAGMTLTITNETNGGSNNDPQQANQLDRLRLDVTLPTSSLGGISTAFYALPTTLSARSYWYSVKDVPLQVDAGIPME